MAPSGWELGDTQGTKSINLNKNCLSRVPKRTLWAVDRHTLGIPV